MSMPKFYSARSQSTANTGAVIRIGALVSSITSANLSSAYTYGTGGIAFSTTFQLPETLTLEAVYICISAVVGTGSADGNINWELREGATAVANVPGTTVVASGTIAVSALAANTWYKYTLPTSQTITAYKRYSFVLGDADGDGTNYIQIIQQIRENGQWFMTNSLSTTNGWTTAGSNAGYQPATVLKFTDGTLIGGATIRATTFNTNNTLLRGIKFSFPATAPRMKLVGASYNGPGTFQILKGAGALPNTTPEKTWTFSSNWPTIGATPAYLFTEEESYTFLPGETYFGLWKPNPSNSAPNKTTAYGGMDADLRALLGGYNGMTCSFVQEVTSTTWSEDTDATVAGGSLGVTPVLSPTVGGVGG